MVNFIRFKEGKEFSKIQKSFIEKFGDRLPKYIWGNPEEIKSGLHRSFHSYTKLGENLKVLPYFHDRDYSICLCISCDTRYIDGTPIPPTLKIIGIRIELGQEKASYDAFINSLVKWWRHSLKDSPFSGAVFSISKSLPSRKN